MSKAIRLAVLCGLALTLLPPAVLAQEGEGAEGWPPRREAGGKLEGERRGELMRKRQAEQKRNALEARQKRAQAPALPFTLSEKGRGELERHHKALRALVQELRGVHLAVRKDVGEGMAPKEAITKHIEEAKAIAKKMVAERASHLEIMAKIVSEEGPALVDRWAEQLLKGPGERPRPELRERKRMKRDNEPENVDDVNPFEEQVLRAQ
ncbi:MAG: hypothetical protein ABIF82_12745 [Planctomycetota bacterium]